MSSNLKFTLTMEKDSPNPSPICAAICQEKLSEFELSCVNEILFRNAGITKQQLLRKFAGLFIEKCRYSIFIAKMELAGLIIGLDQPERTGE